MSYLSVTKWGEYQHYRDRTPIWIKLHVESLHDEKLRNLPISTRLLWFNMLLLAATFQNSVPNSPELIAELSAIPPELCREGIKDLLKMRILREKGTRRAASKHTEAQRKKREEEKRIRAQAKRLRGLAKNLAGTMSLDDLEAYLRSEGADELTARRLASEAKEAA